MDLTSLNFVQPFDRPMVVGRGNQKYDFSRRKVVRIKRLQLLHFVKLET
ncbi:MAG: hypothetical protein KJ600_06205 [Nanoarchaeota archaeon]|nr:hypothetical protein [Nanoarchaeota archaeon]MBU1104117.1 hypothetical protein [Nanoarchaeota archaeon]